MRSTSNILGASAACAMVVLIGSAVCSRAQTNAPPLEKTKKEDGKHYIALETLVMDPKEIGLDAERTIDGMVINTKTPVKVIANDKEQTNLVASSGFYEKNRRFAALGMHSWMSVTYKITEENDKRVTLYVMEFDSAKHARRFCMGESMSKDIEDDKDLELKGSLFYQYLRGSILLKVTWSEPKTDGIDKLIAAYKSKMISF